MDGLLHITDMSWGRINHPSELVELGQKIKVKILSYDEEKNRVSLGLKQTTAYPWENVEIKYPEGTKVKGRIVSITDYGIFIELEQGIEGLIHVSEMSWTQQVRNPSKIWNLNDGVECIVLKVDKENEKISLGIKQLNPDPWESIDIRYPVGTIITGKVRNLTNFGAFVEVEEGIDGLVHISDMSWTKRVNHPSEIMKKGDVVSVQIMSIDRDNKRISLGFKQLQSDPWEALQEKYAAGAEVEGKIVKFIDRGIVAELEGNIEGFVPFSQIPQQVGLKNASDAYEIGETIPSKVLEFDPKKRKIILSIRGYFKDREKAELDEYQLNHKPKNVTIGDVTEELTEDLINEDTEIIESAEENNEINTKIIDDNKVEKNEQITEEIKEETVDEVKEEK